MSETQTTPTPEPEYVPQNVLSSEPDEAPQQEPQEPQDGGEAKPEGDAAEEQRKAERRREAQRIGYLTKQRYAEKARAEAAEARLREIEQRLAQYDPQHQPQATQQDFATAVEQRAAQKVAEDAHNARFADWDGEGIKEFGQERFREACKTVAEMASDQQRQVIAAVAMDIDGGQRAIMELADKPDEAERILAMPPHRMALALAKLAAPETKPKPVSNLPPPIRPPAVGRARGEPDPERGSMEDYKRWSAKQEWRRY
jgi:hypothetical protein